MDALHDVSLDIEFVVVGKTIDFMDEDFNVDIGVVGLEIEDSAVKAVDGFEVLILGVDDPDEGADLSKDCVEIKLRIHEINLARKVPYLKVHEGTETVNSYHYPALTVHLLHSISLEFSRRLKK